MQTEKSQGATPERLNHSDIIVEPRSVNKGGMVESYGNRDADHCLLDFLNRRHMLGPPRIAQERYNIGLRYRTLWYSFNAQGVNLEEMGQGRKETVSEGEIGTGNDALEAKYNKIMKALPVRYRQPVRSICIEDRYPPPALDNSAHAALDALLKTFLALDRKKI